jgi:PRTRC genetic system protein A
MKLVSHHHVGDSPVEIGALYGYWTCGNGVFISAARDGLAVAFPIAKVEVRGLPPLEPMFRMDYPKIKREVMESLLYHAQEAARDNLEELYHLVWDGETFRLHIPAQTRTGVSCKPLDDSPESTLALSFIEIHSHHSMRAFFSKQDDRSEQGFKIFAVVGRVLSCPEIKFRVGLYGYYWEIKADWVCELPDGISDLAERKN